MPYKLKKRLWGTNALHLERLLHRYCSFDKSSAKENALAGILAGKGCSKQCWSEFYVSTWYSQSIHIRSCIIPNSLKAEASSLYIGSSSFLLQSPHCMHVFLCCISFSYW